MNSCNLKVWHFLCNEKAILGRMQYKYKTLMNILFSLNSDDSFVTEMSQISVNLKIKGLPFSGNVFCVCKHVLYCSRGNYFVRKTCIACNLKFILYINIFGFGGQNQTCEKSPWALGNYDFSLRPDII